MSKKDQSTKRIVKPWEVRFLKIISVYHDDDDSAGNMETNSIFKLHGCNNDDLTTPSQAYARFRIKHKSKDYTILT